MSVRKIRENLVLSREILQGLIDRESEIAHCAVIIRWKDKNLSAGWTDMDTSMLVFLGEVLKQRGLDVAKGDG